MEFSALFNAIGNFALYFGGSILFLIVFKFVYTLITPHDEWKLIKEQQNISAALGFSGAVVGFSIALASAATHSVSIVDFITWGFIALIAQCLAFAVMRFVFMPKIVDRIEQNEISAGIMLAAVCIAIGLLNAASMSY